MCMNKKKYLLNKYFNENKKFFEVVLTRLKKIVQEKTCKSLLMFEKTAQKAKLLNYFAKIATKKRNISPESL